MPNKHFREPFDYAYTGLGFYYINGQVTVTDIMKGSPAEAAGFMEGDIIIAIENNMSRNIQVYRNMLQQPGVRLKFLVVRKKDGDLEELFMRVGNILKKKWARSPVNLQSRFKQRIIRIWSSFQDLYCLTD